MKILNKRGKVDLRQWMKLSKKLKKDGIITLFGHIGDKISKNREKKYTELKGA
jgi:hypothetical protein